MSKILLAFFGKINAEESAEQKLEKFLAITGASIGKLSCKWL